MRRRGLTLIEMIMTMAIVGMVVALISFPLSEVIRASDQIHVQADLLAEGRMGLGRMARDIGWLRDGVGSVIAATGRRFEFISQLGNDMATLEQVYFEYQPGQNRVVRSCYVSPSTVTRVASPLMENVQDFSFRYYDLQGQEIPLTPTNRVRLQTSPILETNIWRIEMQVTLASGGQTVSLQTSVYPRNLLREKK